LIACIDLGYNYECKCAYTSLMHVRGDSPDDSPK